MLVRVEFFAMRNIQLLFPMLSVASAPCVENIIATIVIRRLHSPCLLQRRVRRHFVERFAFSAS